HPPAPQRGHNDPPDHALPRGGRGTVRGDRADQGRAADRARLGRRPARALRGEQPRRCIRQGDERMTGMMWLSKREGLRVYKVWTQTVLAPVISSLLFIVVFGLSLGGRIKFVEGFHYREFIVPGLIAMAMMQAAYSNNSASIFQARSD